MRILRERLLLTAIAFLFCLPAVFAQTPTVSVTAGYPIGRPASQVASGNGKYVLLTTHLYNQVFQSTSGTSWSPVSSTGLTSTQLSFIAFGAGTFVVVGNNGTIQSSVDGITWTTRTSGTTKNLQRVYFIDNRFFAIGTGRTLLTSPDGATWTAVSFSAGTATDDFNSLSYGNGWYVLSARSSVAGGGLATVYRSSTAASNSWTVATSSFPGELVNRIQFLKDRFWAFFAGHRMFTSTDASSWTEITNAVILQQPNNTTIGWSSSHQIFNGIWDGTQFNFYGSSQYHSGYGSTFTSPDGVNFTLLPKTAYIVPQESSLVNGTYFVCGNEGIVSSPDGATYQHSGFSFSDMVKTTSNYVAVGYTSSDGQLCTSPDFANWTNRSPAGIRELYTAAYNGSLVLAGGYTGVFASANEGENWTKVYHNPNETFLTMVHGNNRFVAGGYTSDAAFLRYSTDGGTSWTNSNTQNNTYLKVKWVNNRFFALGMENENYTGRLLTSADGSSWTDVTPALGFGVYYFKDVTFDGDRYHVLGIDADGSFFTVSTDTPADAASYGNKAVCSNTPGGVTLGGNWDEGLLEFTGGRFTGAVIDVATGQDYVITSTDGSSWTALPQNSFSTAMAAYASGNTVQMVARGNALFTVSSGTPLPVGLLEFSAFLSGERVQVQWSTATEQNTRQFIIQHSTDGRRWSDVGTVMAAGNSSSRKDYAFEHATPAKGVNFFRLLMQDQDGQRGYSRVALVAYGREVKATSFPNPVNDQLVIRTASAQPGLITLYNAGGQPVKRTRMAGYETSVMMSDVPAGVYIAEIRQGTQQQTLQVVKK